MTWICGIDVGTASTKAVLVKDGKAYQFHQISSGHNYKKNGSPGVEGNCSQGKSETKRYLSNIHHGMRRGPGDGYQW